MCTRLNAVTECVCAPPIGVCRTPRGDGPSWLRGIKQHYRRHRHADSACICVVYLSSGRVGSSTAAEIIDRCRRPTRARPCSVCVSVAPVAGPQLSDDRCRGCVRRMAAYTAARSPLHPLGRRRRRARPMRFSTTGERCKTLTFT